MNMKKIMSLVAASAFAVFALAGCGGDNGAGKAEAPKVLKVGSSIDFPPFEFQDEGQKEYQG
ncbi:MAG: basic amino acid ABC transporter substrate-binding protein, partial [Selenomonas sp.]|nr:basic amino acid ABC transporter substrate-binding protein [Selenomonas sp.]